jgi:hypothetical protein
MRDTRNAQTSRSRRSWFRLSVLNGTAFLTLALLFQMSGHAEEVANDPIVAISTSWKIRLNTPNDNGSLPQIIAVLLPNGTLYDNYMLLELNHTSLPAYSAGGMQLQIWNYDKELTWSDPYSPGSRCRTTDEEISFMLDAELVQDTSSPTGRSVEFTVREFRSSTWGEHDSLPSYRIPTKLQSFDGFSPAECVCESGVNVGGTEVEYMKIDSIKYRFASGETRDDSTDYCAHNCLCTAETKLDSETLERAASY